MSEVRWQMPEEEARSRTFFCHLTSVLCLLVHFIIALVSLTMRSRPASGVASPRITAVTMSR